MTALRSKRPPKTPWLKYRQHYPTSFARRVRGLEPPRPRDPNNSATWEPNAIRCFACGAPIENQAVEKDCWRCGSENFRGERRK